MNELELWRKAFVMMFKALQPGSNYGDDPVFDAIIEFGDYVVRMVSTFSAETFELVRAIRCDSLSPHSTSSQYFRELQPAWGSIPAPFQELMIHNVPETAAYFLAHV